MIGNRLYPSPTDWVNGQVITDTNMNNIEQGLLNISEEIIAAAGENVSLNDRFNEKLDKNFETKNANKVLTINSRGEVIPDSSIYTIRYDLDEQIINNTQKRRVRNTIDVLSTEEVENIKVKLEEQDRITNQKIDNVLVKTKNLADIYSNTTITLGDSFIIETKNYDIILNGTLENNSTSQLSSSFILPQGTYYLKISSVNNAGQTMITRMTAQIKSVSTGTIYRAASGQTISFTLVEDQECVVRLSLTSGNFNNAIINIMLSTEDIPYQPPYKVRGVQELKEEKVSINQGVENSNKILAIDENGFVVPDFNLKKRIENNEKIINSIFYSESLNKADIFNDVSFNIDNSSLEVSINDYIINIYGIISYKSSTLEISPFINFPAGIYTVQFLNDNETGFQMRTRLKLQIVDSNNIVLSRIEPLVTTALTLDTDKNIKLRLSLGTESTESNFQNARYKIMINSGEEVKEYQKPYRGNFIEDLESKKLNKNLTNNNANAILITDNNGNIIADRELKTSIENATNSINEIITTTATKNKACIYKEKIFNFDSGFKINIENYIITLENNLDKIVTPEQEISPLFPLAAGTYTIGLLPMNNIGTTMITRTRIRAYNGNGIQIVNVPGDKRQTFTLENDGNIKISLIFGHSSAKSEFNGAKYGVMINEGESLLTEYYPPYETEIKIDGKGIKDIDVFLPTISFQNLNYNNTTKAIGRSITSALTNFLLPVYKGIKIVDTSYTFWVYRFNKEKMNIRETSGNIYSNILPTGGDCDYEFDFDNYEYKICVRKTVSSTVQRASNLEPYAKSFKLILSLDKIKNYFDNLIIEKTGKEAIEKNNKKIKNILLTENYNLKYANCARPLPLINPYGNIQNVHPKVLYFPEQFGGHYYWMAYTPYFNGDVEMETPCIAYSDDGYAFKRAENDLLDQSDSNYIDFYSDTHIVYVNGTLECWYRFSPDLNHDGNVDGEQIYRRTTTNGVDWTEKELLHDSGTGIKAQALCPIVIYKDNKYNIWVINNSTNMVDYYESTTGANWTKKRSIDIGNFTYNSLTYTPWHGDIIFDRELGKNGTYIAVMMCKNTTGSNQWITCLQTSEDNITYTKPPQVILGEGTWDEMQYRASITKVNDIYRLYYSGLGYDGGAYSHIYGIGISESKTLDKFIGVDY